jgi:hypothetical protein
MLRTLFRASSSQSNQKAAPVSLAAKCIDPSQLKLVAGGEGLPKGGWPMEQSSMESLPKGGWA